MPAEMTINQAEVSAQPVSLAVVSRIYKIKLIIVLTMQ